MPVRPGALPEGFIEFGQGETGRSARVAVTSLAAVVAAGPGARGLPTGGRTGSERLAA